MSNRTSVSISRGGLFTLATFHFQYFVFFVVIYRKKQDIHKATKTEEIGFANWANCPVTELWTAQLGAPNTCFRALLFLSQRYANVFVTIVSIRTRSTRVVYAGIIFDTKSLITVVEWPQTDSTIPQHCWEMQKFQEMGIMFGVKMESGQHQHCTKDMHIKNKIECRNITWLKPQASNKLPRKHQSNQLAENFMTHIKNICQPLPTNPRLLHTQFIGGQTTWPP